MEATRASEAIKVTLRSNMHMDSRVIEVAGFKSEAIFIALLLATLIGPLPSCWYLDDFWTEMWLLDYACIIPTDSF